MTPRKLIRELSARCPSETTIAHGVLTGGIGLLVGFVAWGMTRGFTGQPLPNLGIWEWGMLLIVGCAVLAAVWDRTWPFPATGLYGFGLAAVGMGQIARGFSPGHFFIWGNASDLAGFVLVAALVGWLLQRFPGFVRRLRIPDAPRRQKIGWFHLSQAVAATVIASQVLWIALDARFDRVGRDTALFGLSGRAAACSTALMLLGATILMAWQSVGPWRRRWQYAALAAGLLLTSSIGWSRISVADTRQPIWRQRGIALLVSASMLTFMTQFGLARFLPRRSDWIPRARQASPVLGGLAVLVLAWLLMDYLGQ